MPAFMRATRPALSICLAALALALAGCSRDPDKGYTGTLNNPGGPSAREAYRPAGPRGDFVQNSPTRDTALAPGSRINRFAWRAALDAVNFMPLASADSTGGAIVTDWYTPSNRPDERIKVTVVVGGPDLRADTVRARVFRQERKGRAGQWVDAKVDQQTSTDLENVILTRARELRQAAGQ